MKGPPMLEQIIITTTAAAKNIEVFIHA